MAGFPQEVYLNLALKDKSELAGWWMPDMLFQAKAAECAKAQD